MAFTIKQTPKTEKFNFRNVDTNIEASKVSMTIDGFHYKANTKTEKFNFRNVDTNIEASKVSKTIDGFHNKALSCNRWWSTCSYQSEKIMLIFSIYVAVLYLVAN